MSAAERKETPDLAALSEAATPGAWLPDVCRLRAKGRFLGVMEWGAGGTDNAAYIAALVNAHRASHLLDLRSEAGRGLVALARVARAESGDLFMARDAAAANNLRAALALLEKEPAP